MGVFKNIWSFVKKCCPKKTYYYHYDSFSGYFTTNLDLEDDSTEYIGQTSFLRIIYFDQPPEEEKEEEDEDEEEEVEIAKTFYEDIK